MGCGSSSLKGEKTSDVTGGGMPPAKRVQTNFSEVDFSSGAGADRRGTMAVAPDEARRPTKISENSVDGIQVHPTSPTKVKSSIEHAHNPHADGAKLEPYKSLDENEGVHGSAGGLNKKMELPTEIQSVTIPTHSEVTALATADTSSANPIRA